MRTVTIAKPIAENARPVQDDKSDVHCKNFKLAKMSRHAQEVTTCFCKVVLVTFHVLHSEYMGGTYRDLVLLNSFM